MHLHSMLLSQVDGTSSNEDAQTLHSTGEEKRPVNILLVSSKVIKKKYTQEV